MTWMVLIDRCDVTSPVSSGRLEPCHGHCNAVLSLRFDAIVYSETDRISVSEANDLDGSN